MINSQRSVGREAFDREWPSDPDFSAVNVGLVVEEFVVGLGCNGGVDLLLPSDPVHPLVSMGLTGDIGPILARLPGEIPLLPGLVQCGVQTFPEWFQLFLKLVPDHVDFGVVGDCL